MAGKTRTHQGITLPEGVRVRGNRLQILFTWCGEQQHITIKLEPSAKNIAYAGGLVQTIKREIDLNLFEWAKHFPEHPYAKGGTALPSDTLVGQLLEEYIIESVDFLSGVSWDNYTYRIHNFLKPAFGHIPLADLNAGHVRQWIKQQKHITHVTLKSYLAPLRSALKEAVLDNKIAANPLENFVWPKESNQVRNARRQKKQESGEVDPFNRQEIITILSNCSHRPQEHNMIQFGFWSGLRLEELFALQWGDLDLINQGARIQRALVKRKGYKTNGERIANHTEIKGLKTDGKGVQQRDIILLPEAIRAINAQKHHTQLMGVWVFHHPLHNTHWHSTNQFYNRWRALLLKAGVRYRQPYQMRHTWASMMLESGEDEAWVARMLGHVDTTMVRKTYRRFIPNGDTHGGYRLRNDWGQEIDQQKKDNRK